MSTALKHYLQVSQEAFEEAVVLPTVEDYLDLSIESFQHAADAIDNAMSLAVTLESLADQFDQTETHDQVSLEAFGEKLELVFQAAGMSMPVQAMVPSLEEASEPVKTDSGSSEKKTRVAKVKETIAKIVAWVREKLTELGKKFSEMGVAIQAQTAKTKEGAKKIKESLADKASKVSASVRSPKTKTAVGAFVSVYKSYITLAESSNRAMVSMATKMDKDDGGLVALFKEISEAAGKVLAIKAIDTSEGVDKASLNEVKAIIDLSDSALNTLKEQGIKGRNAVAKAEAALNKTVKDMEKLDIDNDIVREETEKLKRMISIMNSIKTETNKSVAESIKVHRHALNLANRVVSAA